MPTSRHPRAWPACALIAAAAMVAPAYAPLLAQPPRPPGARPAPIPSSEILEKAHDCMFVIWDGSVAFSGVAFDESGLVVTSIAAGFGNLDLKAIGSVQRNGKPQERTFNKLTLIGVDLNRRLALLKVDNGSERLVLPQRQATLPEKGDTTWAVGLAKASTTGNVQKLTLQAHEGVSSGLRTYDDINYLQSDSPIAPSAIGGGLFNSSGKLTAILIGEVADKHGIGFSIPLTDIKRANFKPWADQPGVDEFIRDIEYVANQIRWVTVVNNLSKEENLAANSLLVQFNRIIINLRPKRPAPYLRLVQFYLQIDATDLARQYVDLARKNCSNTPEATYADILLQRKTGNLQEAEKGMRKLAVDPQTPRQIRVDVLNRLITAVQDPLKKLYLQRWLEGSLSDHEVNRLTKELNTGQKAILLDPRTRFSWEGMESFPQVPALPGPSSPQEVTQDAHSVDPTKQNEKDLKEALSRAVYPAKNGTLVHFSNSFEEFKPTPHWTPNGLYLKATSTGAVAFFSPLQGRYTGFIPGSHGSNSAFNNRVYTAFHQSKDMIETWDIATCTRINVFFISPMRSPDVFMHPDNDNLALLVDPKQAILVNLKTGRYCPLTADKDFLVKFAQRNSGRVLNADMTLFATDTAVYTRDGAALTPDAARPVPPMAPIPGNLTPKEAHQRKLVALNQAYFYDQYQNAILGPNGPIPINPAQFALATGFREFAPLSVNATSCALFASDTRLLVVDTPGFKPLAAYAAPNIPDKNKPSSSTAKPSSKTSSGSSRPASPPYELPPITWITPPLLTPGFTATLSQNADRLLAFRQNSGAGILVLPLTSAHPAKPALTIPDQYIAQDQGLLKKVSSFNVGPVDPYSLVIDANRGRYAVVRAKAEPKALIVDLVSQQVVSSIPLMSPQTRFSASGDTLVTFVPDPGVVESWDLSTGKLRTAKPVENMDRLVGIWMAPANTQHAMLVYHRGAAQRSGAFYDTQRVDVNTLDPVGPMSKGIQLGGAPARQPYIGAGLEDFTFGTDLDLIKKMPPIFPADTTLVPLDDTGFLSCAIDSATNSLNIFAGDFLRVQSLPLQNNNAVFTLSKVTTRAVLIDEAGNLTTFQQKLSGLIPPKPKAGFHTVQPEQAKPLLVAPGTKVRLVTNPEGLKYNPVTGYFFHPSSPQDSVIMKGRFVELEYPDDRIHYYKMP